MSGHLPESLPDTAILKNHSQLRALCDLVIVETTDAVAAALRWGPAPATFAPLDDRLADCQDGAIVYVRSGLLDRFFAEIFPRIAVRVVLVTGWSDAPTPGVHRRWLDDPRILRWFGENCDLDAPHPKFEPLPLGLPDPRWPNGDQAALLRVHRRMPDVAEKKLTALANFHLRMTHPARRATLAAVQGLPGVELQPKRVPTELLWVRHANYAFEISPRGNGLDCHRTWEALLLRTIPIVLTSPLDPVYAGFPVVVVEDWREVTPQAMERWRDEHRDGFTRAMFERLTIGWWAERIRRARAAVERSG
jgi:hypothetical protein